MSDTNSVVAIFESHETSEEAIRKLQSSGFELKQLTLVSKDVQAEEPRVGDETESPTDKFFLVVQEKSENAESVKDSPDDLQLAGFNPATDTPYTPNSVNA